MRQEKPTQDPIYTATEAVSVVMGEVWDIRPGRTILRAMSIRIEEEEYEQGLHQLKEVASSMNFEVIPSREMIEDFGVVTMVNKRPIIDSIQE
jgi:hypothetical protein